MSGFQNITGFAPPTSFGGFMSLLQNALWRGVPFHVTGAVTRKGRKQAVHNYAFRDGVWVEDMGRAPRQFSFNRTANEGARIGEAALSGGALDAFVEFRIQTHCANSELLFGHLMFLIGKSGLPGAVTAVQRMFNRLGTTLNT